MSTICPEHIMAIDFRSELRRSITLGLLAVAVVAVMVAIVQSGNASDNRSEVHQLRGTETSLRSELEQQRRAAGTLAELQSKVAAAQQQASQSQQALSQAQGQATAAQQAAQQQETRLADVQRQSQEVEKHRRAQPAAFAFPA